MLDIYNETTLYFKCSHCGRWYSRQKQKQYSDVIISQEWSDGKCFDLDWSEYAETPFVRCNNCEKLFWIDDYATITDDEIGTFAKKEIPKEFGSDNISFYKKIIKDEDKKTKLIKDFLRENYDKFFKEDLCVRYSTREEQEYYFENILNISYPTNEDYEFYFGNNLNVNYPPKHLRRVNKTEYFINDLIELLKGTNNLNTNREIYLRTKLFQHINDLVRVSRDLVEEDIEAVKEKKLYEKYKQIGTKNLRDLSELLRRGEGKGSIAVKITLAEIERERGNFEKAKLLIANLDAMGNHNYIHGKFINISLKLIDEKSTKVFKLN